MAISDPQKIVLLLPATSLNGGGTVPSARGPRIPPFSVEASGFRASEATVDIPLDLTSDSKKRQKELAAWETELKQRERDIKRREDTVAKIDLVRKVVSHALMPEYDLVNGELRKLLEKKDRDR